MTIRRALRRLLDHDLPQIREAEFAVVVLTRTTSGQCDVYQADIERLMGQGRFDGIPIGKVVLDEPSAIESARDEFGFGEPIDVPVTILYRRGRQVERLRTMRACQLVERIALLQTIANPPKQDEFDGDGAVRDKERE